MPPQVDWELVEKRLMLSQDPDTRLARQAAFKNMDPNHNGKLSFTELKGAVLSYLDDDSIRASGEKNRYIVPLKDFGSAIKESYKLARDLKPSRKACQRRGQQDTNIDKSEFHPFLVCFRYYLEVAVAFEDLDHSCDKTLCYKEAEKGMKVFEAWNINKAEVKRQFSSDPWEESLKFTAFASWCIRKLTGSLDLALDDSDNEEVIKEQAAHDVRAAEEMTIGDSRMGQALEASQNQRKVTEAFSQWDKDHSGAITEDEMAEVLMKLNPSLTREKVSIIFSAADKNKDNEIDYTEFVSWLFKSGGGE